MRSFSKSNPFAVAVSLALYCGAVIAQALDAKPVVELRYASSTPHKSIGAMQAERWGRTLEEESGGTLHVNVFLGGQLGADADLVQQVARGRIDAAGVGNGFIYLLAPETQLLLLPFFFGSPAENDCALDRHLAAVVDERLAAKGVKVIGWTTGNTLDFAGRRSFTNPADIAGVKAGTLGTRAMQLMWQSLGANPTVITFPEIPTSFQTGLIDIAPTVPTIYVSSGVSKVAPVLSRIELFYGAGVSIMNKASFDRLSPDQRAAFARTSARIPATQLRQEVRAAQQQVIDEHLRMGGQVATPTPEQRAAFRRIMAPLWPRMAQEAGPEGPKFLALMEQARKACEGAS